MTLVTPIDRMLTIASAESGFSVAEIKGESRHRDILHARYAVMHVAKCVLGYSMPKIGRALGRRDHTTVINGCKRAKVLIEQDVDFADLVHDLEVCAKASAQDQIEQRSMISTVIVHFDDEGELSYFVNGKAVKLLIVDERAPGDRVYEWKPRCDKITINSILKDSQIGSNQDSRHAALAHKIKALSDGKPRLEVVQ